MKAIPLNRKPQPKSGLDGLQLCGRCNILKMRASMMIILAHFLHLIASLARTGKSHGCGSTRHRITLAGAFDRRDLKQTQSRTAGCQAGWVIRGHETAEFHHLTAIANVSSGMDRHVPGRPLIGIPAKTVIRPLFPEKR